MYLLSYHFKCVSTGTYQGLFSFQTLSECHGDKMEIK